MRNPSRRPVLRVPLLAAALALSVPAARGEDPAPPPAGDAEAWSYSASLYGYYDPEGVFGQPTLTADRGALHLEARYNYEDRDTASLWLGYNLSFGEKVTLELTPMLGGVFGKTEGIAPGFKVALAFGIFELYSEGEYVVDLDDSSDSFFYSWNELTLAPADWIRFGLVAQRTRAYDTELDIQRGLLVGLSREAAGLTLHLFNPDKEDPVAVVSMSLSF